jgi:sulfite reductase (NADPH) flavoprotein alpha-component
MQNPETALFSDDQWGDIQRLLDQLSVRQSQWLSNYLNAQHSDNPAADSGTKGRIAVAYGSETGNSKALAECLHENAVKQGKQIELLNLANIKLRQLSQFQQLFIVCSTHGDGDPPEPVEAFYEALMASQKTLQQLEYAVLALGDSSYEKFCETGIQLDNKLSALKAKRLLDRIDCDVDFEEQAESWIKAVISLLAESSQTIASASLPVANSDTAVSKKNPVEIELLENVCLTSADRSRAIHHLELDLSNTALALQPGDSLGVMPQNPPELVSRILDLLGFTGDESVTVTGKAMPLVQALREHRDLNIVSAKFIRNWKKVCDNPLLQSLADSETKIIRDYLKQHQLADIICEFGGHTEAQFLIDSLRPLQPRLYDVANSLNHTPGECHLTVERYIYKLNGKHHQGLASHYLCDLGESETLLVYPQENKRFRLPLNKTVPLILIAESTGIAPFRAFLQELAIQPERQHQTWLIFQEHAYKDDFLYQLEWQQALKNGDLTRLDSFFSEDMPGMNLFDCVAEHYETFRGWLQAGAHCYLAGHKSQLEHFEKTLGAALGSDPSGAKTWSQMAEQGRIHRNYY